MKTTKNSWATAKNTEEQQELNVDLSYEEGETYGCRGSPRFSGRFRVMQRPRTTRMRSSVAAATELEQRWRLREEKDEEERRMRKT